MKLKKSKLLELTRLELLELGYKEFKDTVTAANGLFVKPIKNNYFLSLGLTISNHYNSRFTAAYYLSKTTRWGSIWGDIPGESYRRIGHFLTKEERQVLLDEDYRKDGVRDAWWESNDERKLLDFFKAVGLTEERFLSQEMLLQKIESSQEIKKLEAFSAGVLAFISRGDFDEKYNYRFIPGKPIDDVPIHWFQAAEVILSTLKGTLNENTVKALAVDAWRQRQLHNEPEQR